jgi:hypothetical protein
MLLKEFNASVLELSALPIQDLAEMIIKFRKKNGTRTKKEIRKPQKKSSKRLPIIDFSIHSNESIN